jgi:hypothetical protein
LQNLRSHDPRVHFGTVASGSNVIASKKMQSRLLSLHGKIVASEMEGAGLLAQTFTHEMPTPAIVVKGISDYADPKKAAADDSGYWRQLACENSIRLALAMIRRGRVRPLQTDQFALDPTCGTIEETRSHIPDPASPGVSLRGFPQLLLPCGPITTASININATKEDGASVRIHKLVVSCVSHDDGKRASAPYSADKPIILSKLAPEPVGVYLMLAEKAEVIRFSIKTPAEEHATLWQRSRTG